MSGRPTVDALALVPARNEAERVGATVRALRSLRQVAEVLVVSDGSTDATAARALEAGAHCLDLPRNLGKGGALNAGLAALMERVADGVTPEPAVLLLADADLADTAAKLDALLAPVLAGEADVAIADLPAQHGAGGFGLAMGLARWGMQRARGRRMREPLSGQRAVRWSAVPLLAPFAPGFGVEVAMTMDALAAGLEVIEVEVDLRHAATGRDLAGIVHRGRQAGAIARELARRRWQRASRQAAVRVARGDPGAAPSRLLDGGRGGRDAEPGLDRDAEPGRDRDADPGLDRDADPGRDGEGG